jgi:glycosyltransferase involved in cell wall biosynthesis
MSVSETIYMLDDHLGGIASFCGNLINNSPPGAQQQIAILLTDKTSKIVPIKEPLRAENIRFEYLVEENVYSVLRRLAAILPRRSGAIVSNSGMELAMFSLHEPQQTVYQVVHDDYNLRLAQTYEPVVDVFIAHSRYFFDQLRSAFPHRTEQIFHLPYGIRLAPRARAATPGPLRLVFLGRVTEQKGALDLPEIDVRLRTAGVEAYWMIIGDGSDRDTLMERLPPSTRVRYASPATNEEVLALCAEGDMLIFPTRFEGFPVALLEAMSAGLVPLVSDLPSGVPEVVTDATGFRVPIGDIDGFVGPVVELDRNRDRLETMSRGARARAGAFNVRDRAEAYHQLFARAAELKRPWEGPLPIKRGSRLDQPYLPNGLVLATRRTLAFLSRPTDSVSAP